MLKNIFYLVIHPQLKRRYFSLKQTVVVSSLRWINLRRAEVRKWWSDGGRNKGSGGSVKLLGLSLSLRSRWIRAEWKPSINADRWCVLWAWHERRLRKLLFQGKGVRGELHVSEGGRRAHGGVLLRLQWLEVLLRWPEQLLPIWIWIHVVAEVRDHFDCILMVVWRRFGRWSSYSNMHPTCSRSRPSRSDQDTRVSSRWTPIRLRLRMGECCWHLTCSTLRDSNSLVLCQKTTANK